MGIRWEVNTDGSFLTGVRRGWSDGSGKDLLIVKIWTVFFKMKTHILYLCS